MSNDINLPEAKFAHALDEYYGFLHKLVANNGGTVGPGQRLVTMNTITPYSIVKDKPLYNMFVLRAYADLVIRKGSAKDAGSPSFLRQILLIAPTAEMLGVGNISD